MELDTKLDLAKLLGHKNIAEELSDEDRATIVNTVLHDYRIDLESRAEWEINTAEALKLALQVTEEKTTPWVGAANVKFPLVTIAALQCHAREYPALITGTDLVKCRVIGEDPNGMKGARANRVSNHMSFQILEEDENWEDQMDRVMFTKPIIGCSFKKIYFDPVLGHNVSELILAQKLVIPYYAKSLEKASRLTHIMELSKNDIYERVVRGIYLDELDPEAHDSPKGGSELQKVSDEVQGRREVAGDDDAPITVLEQHRYLDLDGDGYAEPYIVTVAHDSKALLRIVARYFKDDIQKKNGKVIYIRPQKFFVKYGMIPSPDGGIYDLGFGSLLGPINETVNSLLNQLLDAGTLSNLGGGFLGRGARLRRGQNQFKPGEWKQVDGTGADLKGSVVPLPMKEPSPVLFALLGMLVNYGERIAGATDIMTGQNVGQNTPASTAQELVKQGSVIFNGIFKRTYRSLKEEYRMLYRLNQLYLENQTSFESLSTGDSMMILREDYHGKETDIRPSSDPNIASVEKRMQQAIFLKQAAQSGPGYKQMAVEKRLLEAAQIPYMNEVWDEQNVPQPKVDVKVQVEQMKLEFLNNKLKADMQYKMLELMQQAEKVQAEIFELQAKAQMELKSAQGVDMGHAIAMMNLEIAVQKHKRDGVFESIRIIKELMDSDAKRQELGGKDGSLQFSKQSGGMGGMASSSGEQGSQAVSPVSGGAT